MLQLSCNVLFLGHNFNFEVFLSIHIYVQQLGRDPQIHTTGIFYGQKPLVISAKFFVIGNCNLFINF